MTLCLDIHTHHPAPQPMGVVAVSVDDFHPIEAQKYSIGIHPWLSDKNISEETWNKFEKLAKLPCVVAIGECGIDLGNDKGGVLYRQLLVFKRQIEISEKLGKPLVIHDVKAHDIITGLKRDLNPKQKWVIHGFRNKPTVARMMTDRGIYLSFGEKFNPSSLSTVPQNLVLAETDESSLSIEDIIANISNSLGKTYVELRDLISSNSEIFLFGGKEIQNPKS